MKARRLIALITAALLLAVGFAACSSEDEEDEVAEATESTETEPADNGDEDASEPEEAEEDGEEETTGNGDMTIGVVFYSRTDALGASVYELVNQAADTMDVSVNWQIGASENEVQIQEVENLVASGVDGVMVIPLSDSVALKEAEACEAAGVKFAFVFRNVSDPDIKAEIMAMEHFVGMTSEDETGTAAELVRYMNEAGRTNLGIGFCTPGNAMMDARNAGLNQGLDENDVDMLAEFTIDAAGDPNQTSASVQSMLTAYPDIDGVVLGGGGNGVGEAVDNYMSSIDRDVAFATFDAFEGIDEAFNEGRVIAAAGGAAPDALYTFMMLYNACNGTPVSDSPVELSQPYIFVTSAEEFAMYSEYIGDANKIGEVYNADFIKSLSKESNPDLDAESLQAIMNEYSIEWVQDQVGG